MSRHFDRSYLCEMTYMFKGNAIRLSEIYDDFYVKDSKGSKGSKGFSNELMALAFIGTFGNPNPQLLIPNP